MSVCCPRKTVWSDVYIYFPEENERNWIVCKQIINKWRSENRGFCIITTEQENNICLNCSTLRDTLSNLIDMIKTIVQDNTYLFWDVLYIFTFFHYRPIYNITFLNNVNRFIVWCFFVFCTSMNTNPHAQITTCYIP